MILLFQVGRVDWRDLLWEIEIIYATALAHEEILTLEKLQQISQFVDKIEGLVIWYKQNGILPLNDEEC